VVTTLSVVSAANSDAVKALANKGIARDMLDRHAEAQQRYH
jgi:hypothetical protein